MCICLSACKRKLLAWLGGEIHPLFLTIKDSQLQEDFRQMRRLKIVKLAMYGAISLTSYSVFLLIKNKDSLEQTYPIILAVVPTALVLALFWLIDRRYLFMLDFTFLTVVIVRCVTTQLTF